MNTANSWERIKRAVKTLADETINPVTVDTGSSPKMVAFITYYFRACVVVAASPCTSVLVMSGTVTVEVPFFSIAMNHSWTEGELIPSRTLLEHLWLQSWCLYPLWYTH
ncbi:hypothetical protein N7453_010148 [Penicillium expansum]|nr:hypothetical protein N7453_010148 [Penicillium expansum]